jgi:hypothetical protein
LTRKPISTPNANLESQINTIIAQEAQLADFATQAYAYGSVSKKAYLNSKPLEGFSSAAMFSKTTQLLGLEICKWRRYSLVNQAAK